jgi:threonine aldolase
MSQIDLRSDTVTHPTPAMRQAMANAEVGDDGWGDDPTVNRLQEVVAEMLGKEAALFVPSGTMANLASVLSHCQRGDEIIVGDQSHVYLYEYSGASAFGGVAYRQLPNAEDGTLDPDMVESAIRPLSSRFPNTALVCLENTHNRCSGVVITPEYTDKIVGIAHKWDAAVHLDGARMFNAAVSLGIPPRELVRSVDSLMFCFSKGLGCPVGSIICGTKDFVQRARRVRNSLGGGMRQVGVLAAAALVALEEMVERLAGDHHNARRLAEGLSRIPGIILDPARVQTNIVMFEMADGDALGFLRRIEERGVQGHHPYGPKVRMVTHYGIDEADIDAALDVVELVMREQYPAKKS